ncbi:histone deacetylase HOS3 [Kwoniella heveanensis BCC8398]|uniref:Histone deacetylase HOS3 n=1 Tax=Kwoniella heveanensis BCC8398 TaxID=1296120 RepID=A0A1B9GL35_9TREE|nr:histone deacetylase HOS3 [Kwoniella heveanensis BCC8398]
MSTSITASEIPPISLAPLGLFIQPACLQHKYIRHANSSHIFERPERLRAVLLGVAAAVARLEANEPKPTSTTTPDAGTTGPSTYLTPSNSATDDLSGLLSSLSIASSISPSPNSSIKSPITKFLHIIPPPPSPFSPGSILLHHPAVQLAHSPAPEAPFPYLGVGASASSGSKGDIPSSEYLRNLVKWAGEAVEKIKETGCEIPNDLGLNPGDLYLGPGSIIAIEGAIQSVCQAVDHVAKSRSSFGTPPRQDVKTEPSTPPTQSTSAQPGSTATSPQINKAFCAIRPPGHHCGEDLPSGFCYVNNVVIGAMHGYLQHDIDRAIIIDFDLHHGNGTQALVMPLNAASYAEDLQVKAGKPIMMTSRDGRRRRGWKGFYGSVHDIDGDLDLIKDASISLAAHGQYIENIHLQPYEDEADFYARIYPLYLALLEKARVFMQQTEADPSRTIVLISAGFDACEHEHQGMQRHDRRVPASFFSRYTKDIVAFAEKYTEGKVVSVLEGGYSDRALTSAAMGHIVGMTGGLPEGCNNWWTESELVNLEKATKKRRTGKLAPFPNELSSHPHLQRTHTLLGHFEGTGSVESAAPSVASTPQPATASRMTLRDRRKPDETPSADITPPARRTAQSRSKLSNNSTTPINTSSPTRVIASTSHNTPTQPTGRPAPEVKTTTPSARMLSKLKLENEDIPPPLPAASTGGALGTVRGQNSEGDDALEAAMGRLAGVSLGREDKDERASGSSDQSQTTQIPLAGHAESSASHSIASKSVPTEKSSSTVPKIILRIPRPNANSYPVAQSTRPDSSTQQSTYINVGSRANTVSVYPDLPRVPVSSGGGSFAGAGYGDPRTAYREGSTSTEGGSGSEYLTAQSGTDSEDVKKERV